MATLGAARWGIAEGFSTSLCRNAWKRGSREMRRILVFLMIFSCVPSVGGESNPAHSLCAIQRAIAPDGQIPATVAGKYELGLAQGVLSDSNCPLEQTWVEFQLTLTKNEEQLRSLLKKYRAANVVFEGTFFGPPLPDERLPTALREAEHPG